MSGFSVSHKDDHTRNRINTFYAEQAANSQGDSINWMSWFLRLVSVLIAFAVSLFLYFVTIHYLPIYQGSDKIVSVQDLTQPPSPIATQPASFFAPLTEKLSVQRVHINRDQSLEASYLLPQGVNLKLEVERCAQGLLTEIFQCTVLAKSETVIENDLSGKHVFKYQGEGFYRFKETLTVTEAYIPGAGKYHVTWRRS